MGQAQPSDQKSLYANLMEEVNARLEGIVNAARGKFQMHEMFAEEFCYFQLRMICETIACACLVAHGDLTGNIYKLRSEWSADKIVKLLTALHSDFYPKPRKVKFTHQIEIEHKTNGFLTRKDFLRLYGLVHSRSHRGSLDGMSERPPYKDANFTPIIEWTRKIEELLNDHLIQSPDQSRSWLVLQKGHPHGTGHPEVVYVKR
jgi:hypothetical protein